MSLPMGGDILMSMLYRFPEFLNRQIPILNALSLGPGIAYVILGYMHGIGLAATIWYAAVVGVAYWGVLLHRRFQSRKLKEEELHRWYLELRWYFYIFFGLWTIIFILYVPETESNMHYIAIFTQIGASVVASALLVSDKRLYQPTLAITVFPLSVYFFLLASWYGYVLSVFSLVFFWVLRYSATSTYALLLKSRKQALHDALTGLFNRRYAIEFLQDKIDALQEKDYSYLFLIDLDYFKTINDSLGHDIGDLLLKEVAERMHDVLDKRHMTARLGGDEFVVISKDHGTFESMKKRAEHCAQNLLDALKKDYRINENDLYISASVGISMIDRRHFKAFEFLKDADIAMYEVKSIGRDGVYIFDTDMAKRVERRLSIISKLHFAIEHEKIALFAQPQVNSDGIIVGCEILSRWFDDELGQISPMEFIVAAEQTGQMVEVGNYVLENSVKAFQKWSKQGYDLQQYSVNISMRQFFQHNFVDVVLKITDRYLTPKQRSKLMFEITETVAAENIEKVSRIISELEQYGIAFSLDDFGTGYSSLSYLNRLPIKELKIDKSFVDNIDSSDADKTMLRTIFFIAGSYGFKVVAEGVERSTQFEVLKEERCDIYQGYFFGKPMSLDAFESIMEKQFNCHARQS